MMTCSEQQVFIAWDQLKKELENMLLPQVRQVPIGSTLELRDLADRRNWVVRVINPESKDMADVWLGVDADNKWAWDGLVRIGDSHGIKGADKVVWQVFQRYSDGSYRRIEGSVSTTLDPLKKFGFP